MSTISEDLVISPTAGSRFLPPFTVDAATLSASAAAASAPVSNLQNKFRGKGWRGDIPAQTSVYDEGSGLVMASMAAGQAFVVPGIGSGADLSPFARTHKIVVVDSNGKTAWGYLGTAGVAEGLGDELMANGDFASDLSGWTLNVGAGGGSITWDAGALKISQGGSSVSMNARQENLASELDKLYRAFFSIVEQSSGVYTRISIGKAGGAIDYYYTSPYGGTRDITKYICPEGQMRLQLFDAQAAAQYSRWDDISLKEVTAPQAAGCWITSTPGGSDGDAWAYREFGFNPNAIVAFDLYPVITWVDVDFGEEVDLNAVALVNHNLEAEALILVMLGSSAGAEDMARGVFPGWTPFFSLDDSLPHGCGGFLSTVEAERLYWTGHLRLIYFDAIYTARYMRVGFWNPDNSDGLISVGRLLAGEYLEAESMPTVGGSLGIPDASPVSTSDGGQTWKDGIPRSREASYKWDNTPGDQTYILWLDMLRRLGVAEGFVADLMPGVMARNIDQRLNNLLYFEIPASGIKALSQPFLDQGSVTLTLKEAL